MGVIAVKNLGDHMNQKMKHITEQLKTFKRRLELTIKSLRDFTVGSN